MTACESKKNKDVKIILESNYYLVAEYKNILIMIEYSYNRKGAEWKIKTERIRRGK